MKFSIFNKPSKYKTNLYNKSKKRPKTKLVLFMVLIIFLLSSCNQEPIKISFIGDLSSKNSQLAIDARNSLALGISLINDQGGVNGREIELTVKDDLGSQEEAFLVHQQLKDEGIKFVLGHLNSNMAPVMEESAGLDLLFVSPSISTITLSEKDDFIIRSSPINSSQASVFVDYALKNDLEDIVIVYDLMNKEYSQTVVERVSLLMEQNNKPIKQIIEYDTRSDELYLVADKIVEAQPQNIFVVAQATDTAFFIQRVSQSLPEISSYSVSWSMTKDLISNGGASVEGTKFIGVYIPEEFTPEYRAFATEFYDNYGYELSFIGVLAYDALNVLVKGMEMTEEIEPDQVKNSIIDIGNYQGLYNDFNVDQYGDNDKKYMMYELNQGEFTPLRDWNN